MALDEFDIIAKYFTARTGNADVALGVGDDAALIQPPASAALVVATDTLCAGFHFPHDFAAWDLGFRAMAVNLSDFAAMGAEPRWMTLALTIPESEPPWLEAFSAGLVSLARTWNIVLIGGDLTRGPLTVTLQILGVIPEGDVLRRSGARPGDDVFVTGTLGDASLGLDLLTGARRSAGMGWSYLTGRFAHPIPRLRLSAALRGYASSAIDISDGLYADLGHILSASGVGACLALADLPISKSASDLVGDAGARHIALTGGDDYELCFTAQPDMAGAIADIARRHACRVSRIGSIVAAPGLHVSDGEGEEYILDTQCYRHF